jgi:uncharacterized membrane protein HdeD (DUF308 family)
MNGNSGLQRRVAKLGWGMEWTGFISLLAGAVVLFAFAIGVDLSSIDYITFMIGLSMVLTGLAMLYRCELKRTRMLK